MNCKSRKKQIGPVQAATFCCTYGLKLVSITSKADFDCLRSANLSKSETFFHFITLGQIEINFKPYRVLLPNLNILLSECIFLLYEIKVLSFKVLKSN